MLIIKIEIPWSTCGLLGHFLGLALLCWKIIELGVKNELNIIFVVPFVTCFATFWLSGIAEKNQEARSPGTEGPSVWSRTIESFLMTVYWPELLRLTQCGRSAEEEECVSECNQERLVNSARSFGIAIVSTLIFISRKTGTGFGTCTTDDVSTGLIILWGLLMTVMAAVLYDTRFHRQRSSTQIDYSASTFIEKFWLFLLQLLRLCWILQFLAFCQLLYPWIAGPIWLITFFAFNIISRLAINKCLHSYLPMVPESLNFKEILHANNFLFTSPTTLPCSLGSIESIRWGQLALIVRDIFPMLIGQVVMSVLAAGMAGPVVRETPYMCRIDREPNWTYEVPTTFRKGDWVGFTIFGLYTVALFVYWICAQRWLRRKEQTII